MRPIRTTNAPDFRVQDPPHGIAVKDAVTAWKANSSTIRVVIRGRTGGAHVDLTVSEAVNFARSILTAACECAR